MKSEKFDKVKAGYDNGSWNDTMVRNAVSKGWITEDEYTEITGRTW